MRLRRSPAILAVVLAATVAALAEEAPAEDAPHRGDQYPGANALFSFTDVVVVYPAASGQDAARNRRSAEARAAFLRKARGVNVRIVSDREATAADLAENLLVLGWDNGVLGSEKAPRPFRNGAQGLEFLGLTIDEPSPDVLLFARSPFNPERFLYFWSRLDPELDRFLVLPRLGSDWAVFRGYGPVLQGMLRPGRAWPPARDPRAEADHRPTISAFLTALKVHETEHYTILFDGTRVGPEELAGIARARESAWAKAAERVGAARAGGRIRLTVYEDEETKKRLTGVVDVAHSMPRDRELHMTRRAARSGSAHEEIHILSRSLLGPAYVTAIYEGHALALDGTYKGLDIELAGLAQAQRGLLPSIAALLDEESWRSLPESVSSPAAGLLSLWLRARASADSYRRAYGIADGTPDALAAALARPAGGLEDDFRAWATERAVARKADLDFLAAESEARDRHAVGDYGGMIAALRRMLEIRPSDPQTLFNLAAAQMRADRLADARDTLARMLAVPRLGARDGYFRAFAHYQLGRTLDLLGRREEALSEYRTVLEMPDVEDSHRLARERLESPATREQLE